MALDYIPSEEENHHPFTIPGRFWAPSSRGQEFFESVTGSNWILPKLDQTESHQGVCTFSNPLFGHSEWAQAVREELLQRLRSTEGTISCGFRIEGGSVPVSDTPRCVEGGAGPLFCRRRSVQASNHSFKG